MATRTATSAVMSTFARPRTPRPPNGVRAPRLSHTIDELTTAPASTVLNEYTLTPGLMTDVLADEALVADDDAFLDARVAADVGGTTERAAPQPGAAADVDVVVADRPARGTRRTSRRRRCRAPCTRQRRAPASTRQLSPITTGPSMRTVGVDLRPLAQPHALPDAGSRGCRPGRGRRARRRARSRYASVVPTSSQYPSMTCPCSRRSLSRIAGNTSPEKSTTSPSAMKSNTDGSIT